MTTAPSIILTRLDVQRLEQLIFSRQEPLRQLWLAARSGGVHFDYDEESGKWQCDKSEELLGEMLTRLVQEYTGVELDFDEV